jgi:thiol:disulfide interchange protein
MPCVFPVLSIKVLSLVQSHEKTIKLHGLMYTLGIVACFLAFAGLLLVAKAGGQAVGWGFQLQSPGLITALAYLFFVMGLAMAGYIQLGGSLMGAGQNLTEKSGLQGSFFTGVLAAVVASPCTAPFMGAALGFALTQPAYVCIAVFSALGLGMAAPLLLLCFLPQLAQKLPKPGIWMETLKEFLAFPLYISAIWLLWVLTNQAGSGMMLATCLGAVAIAFASWIHRRPAQGWASKIYTTIALLSLLLAIFIPYQTLKTQESGKRWGAYTPQLLTELRAQGRPVFIDVTADWCITCKVNERTTLTRSDVEATFDELNVVTLKADWTNADPEIEQLLHDYGRIGVPLYIWFPAGNSTRGEVLPQLLTPSIVINTIKPTK